MTMCLAIWIVLSCFNIIVFGWFDCCIPGCIRGQVEKPKCNESSDAIPNPLSSKASPLSQRLFNMMSPFSPHSIPFSPPSPRYLSRRGRSSSTILLPQSILSLHHGENIPINYSLVDFILQSSEYSNRKHIIKFEMKNKTKSELKPEQYSESSLLILDGRQTIFDSVEYNPLLIRILQKHALLFFRSDNYVDTINVIRQGIVDFIHKLIEISNGSKLYAMLM
eukprot:319008_1